jgi:hypothetical protein
VPGIWSAFVQFDGSHPCDDWLPIAKWGRSAVNEAPFMNDFTFRLLVPFLFVGLPAVIVAKAAIRNRREVRRAKEDREREARKVKADREPVIAPDQKKLVDFHQAEFVSLKSEIAELVKATAANYQYAVLASAGVFTWLFTAEHKEGSTLIVHLDKTIVIYAVWIPLIITALFLWLTCGLYIRISEIARYLRRLEDALGSCNLGWEKAFEKHPGTLGPIYAFGWFLLLVGDWLLALYLPGPS